MQNSGVVAAKDTGFRKNGPYVFSTSGIARMLLASTAIYVLLASIFVFFAEIHRLRFLNFYYFLMVTLSAALAVSSLTEIKLQRQNFLERGRWLRVFVIVGLGVVAWFAYRYPHLCSFSLWQDEVTQFQGDWTLPRRPGIDPALFAASQQQPPIDYYFSAFARVLLGTTEFAARVHTLAFGILSFGVFLIWLIRIRFPLLLSPIPILIFAAHQVLVRFSSEARPISLGVFFALITLIFVHESIEERRACVRPLLASSLLLLYSLGLQPIFFLEILGVSLLPLLVQHFRRSEAMSFLVSLSVAPLVLFSPTVWEIYRESDRNSQFYTSSYVGLWWSALEKLSWKSFYFYLHTIQYAQWMFFIPVAILVLSIFLKRDRLGRTPPTTGSWAVSAIIFFLLFPLLFQVFWGIVNWLNQPHYFVLWVVGFLALTSLSVAYFLRPFIRGRSKRWAKPALLLLGVCGTYALHVTYVGAQWRKVDEVLSLRPNWHAVIKEGRDATRPVKIIEIPYAKFGFLRHHIVSGLFYENPPKIRMVNLEKKVNRWGFVTVDIHKNETVGDLNGPSDLFYLIIAEEGQKNAQDLIVPALKANVDQVLPLSNHFLLARINNQDPASAVLKTKHIFESLIAVDPSNEKNFYLADALVSQAVRMDQCAEARKWLGVAKSIHVNKNSWLYGGLQGYFIEMKERIDDLPSCP